MQTFRTLFFSLFSLCLLCPQAFAQGQAAPAAAERVTVVASAAPDRVRFAAPNRVARLRLEVLSASGDVIFAADSRGSVLDWTLQDSYGGRLADGRYLCVVTVKDVAGRITQRLTLLEVAGGLVAARAATSADLTARQAEAVGPVEAEGAGGVGGEATAAALLAHDGETGQLVTTAGDLSFRGGDFFTGKDKELMRLSADGSLEVMGALSARGGIRFDDGTVLTSAAGLLRGGAGKGAKGAGAADPGGGGDGGVAPAATGAGTVNRLAKWAETGGAGALADSAVTEAGGQVGIGVASPGDSIDIAGPANQSGRTGIRVRTTSAAGNSTLYFDNDRGDFSSYGGLLTGGSQNTFSFFGLARADRTFLLSDGPTSLGLGIGTLTAQPVVLGTGNAERVRIDASGNVGVGTAAPTQRLEVNGNLKVTGDAVVDGNIAAKYQDVAEWVPGRGELPAGTVVVLDRSRTNGVVASRRAYSTHVAGVVSAQPGVILGEGGAGQVMVATTGRVKVKADATARPIRIGDLLVASDSEGVAMRSVPVRAGGARLHRPGTILGKALEPLASGRGEILVLLSMQ